MSSSSIRSCSANEVLSTLAMGLGLRDVLVRMAVSFEFLRGVLGVLCVFFGHLSGRSAVAVKTGRQRPRTLWSWVVRTLICAIAIWWRFRGDVVNVAIWTITLVAFALGWWDASRERKPE